MKLFNKRRFLIISSLILSTTLSSSCSAFFGESGYLITSTSTSLNENGDTVLTINFSSDEQKPLTITIPKGISGKDGVGIAAIVPSIQGDKVKITIKYTDVTLKDTVIEVPVVQGKDGKGIQDVIVGKDEFGNTTIKFSYTDGTEGELITIPKGADGNGISAFEVQSVSEDGLTTTYKITFTNGEIFTFDVKSGRNGISIQTIEFDELTSTIAEYSLKITYSDGYSEYIKIPKPTSNGWHNGVLDNPDNGIGLDGDFYLNVVNGNVYLKEKGSWNLKFSIKDDHNSELEASTILFRNKTNDGAYNLYGTESVIRGKTLKIEEIPILTDSNKKFLGWHSTKQEDQYAINAGKFTDLTVISVKTLYLYAWWG